MQDIDIATVDEILKTIQVNEGGYYESLNDAINKALSEAATLTDKYSKSSTLTLTLTVEPAQRGEVNISAKLGKKVAKGETLPIKLFLTRSKELSFENPVQPRLGFEDHENTRN